MSSEILENHLHLKHCRGYPPEEPKLCPNCSAIGLNAESFAIGQEHDHEAVFILGKISEIRQSNCALCALVEAAIQYDPQMSTLSKEVQDFEFQLRWSTSGRFEYNNWGERPNLRLN